MIAKSKNSNGFAPIAAIFIVLGILIAGGGTYLAKDKIFQSKTKEQQIDQNYNPTENQQFQQNETIDTANTNEKQIGYIKKIYEKDGKRYLDIDYVQWLEGDEASKAALEDKQCTQLDFCTPNGFYVRNQNTQIRTLEISKNAQIVRATAFDYSPDGVKPISYEELKTLLASSGDAYTKIIPFNIEINNGLIINITEQYIP